MTAPRYLVPLLGAALAVLATSCIDSREEFWLEADGSGHAEIRTSLPAAALRMQGGEEGVRRMIAEFLKDTPAITSSHYEITTADGRAHLQMNVAFDSALDLVEVASGPAIDRLPSAASHFAGEVKLGFHGRTLDLERRISPGKALPGAGLLPSSVLDGHQLVYIVHLPAVASDHNATRSENQGRTLVWEIPLAAAVSSPVITRFKMDVPVPWKLVSGIAIPAGIVIVIVFLRFRRAGKPVSTTTVFQ